MTHGNAEDLQADHSNEEGVEQHAEKDLDEKDVAYSPASETETAAKQASSGAGADAPATHSDVDDERVKTLPGTGGPDDVGEIEVDPDDLDLGGSEFPGHARSN
ncbi:hypothetical protein [Herbiconiux sp. L3-i23]|uniref:hypothetical protein n=1 Tax=Herbiconiux sp. L3-i23 TaxID=2905871 RepID=UPI00205C0426|nr:hypothetical protein [Herbiconiux sp. L3-i23]BDI21958.1 hypothetical protein L3i23_07340 [Herbiconiux sp. L3-i23]